MSVSHRALRGRRGAVTGEGGEELRQDPLTPVVGLWPQANRPINQSLAAYPGDGRRQASRRH
jgi:hypothetical protein